MPSFAYLTTALLALGQIANATLLTREQTMFCDTQPDADILALHEKLSKDELHLTQPDTGEVITLETWVNVIGTNKTKEGGWLTVCFHISFTCVVFVCIALTQFSSNRMRILTAR